MRRGLLIATCLFVCLSPIGAQPASGVTGRVFDAGRVLQALERAYPDWVAVRPGILQSTVIVDGREFVWAEGRLLPPEKADHWADYAPQPFYEYPSEVLEVNTTRSSSIMIFFF